MSKPPQLPTGRPHFHRTVSDMKVSIDFYVTRLGFFYDHGVRDVAWLTRGGMLLTLGQGDPEVSAAAYFGFALETEDELQAAFDRLFEQRARLSGPPDSVGGRAWFFVYDPDGYPTIFSWTRLEYPEKL